MDLFYIFHRCNYNFFSYICNMNTFERGRNIHETLEIGAHAAAIDVTGLAYLIPKRGMCTLTKKACHEYFQLSQGGERPKKYLCYTIVGGKKRRISQYIGKIIRYDGKLYHILK